LQACLSRWKTEVHSDVAALETSIADVNARIRNMYDEESLLDLEYRLHAVMVHEGGVDSGHYWAYVLDHRKVPIKYPLSTH
jgi:ubiquitin carboxyl-terminal hydrolase 25/28